MYLNHADIADQLPPLHKLTLQIAWFPQATACVIAYKINLICRRSFLQIAFIFVINDMVRSNVEMVYALFKDLMERGCRSAINQYRLIYAFYLKLLSFNKKKEF